MEPDTSSEAGAKSDLSNSTVALDPLSLQCLQDNNATEDFGGTLKLNLKNLN
jgi:hypothetical protein